jgi:hypothetical protein
MTEFPCEKERDEYNAAYLERKKVFREVGLEVTDISENEIVTYIKGADLSHGQDQEKLKSALEKFIKADKAFDDCLKKHKDWA